MSTIIAGLYKRARAEMEQVDWTNELRNTVKGILKDRYFEKTIQANAEYTANLTAAQDFIDRLLKSGDLTPEVFFFAVKYFLLIIDEEHSRMDWFKYQGQLAAYPVCAKVKIRGSSRSPSRTRYALWDQLSKQYIVSINGKPAVAYLESVAKSFQTKSHTGLWALQVHADHLNIFNPLYPIRSIKTESRELGPRDLSRRIGIVQQQYSTIEDPSVDNVIPADVPFDYFKSSTFLKHQWDSKALRSSKKPLIVVDLRGNGGGFEINVVYLLIDILSMYCPKTLTKRVDKDFAAFRASRIRTEELQYEQFLEMPIKDFREIQEMFNKPYTPDKSIMKQIYKAAKAAESLPTVAVLINDFCYSACRSACRILMALPNIVFIGSSLYIKDPVSVNQSSLFKNRFVRCTLALYPRLNDKYTSLKADLPGDFTGSGLLVCMQILREFESLQAVVKKKLAGKHRPFLFIA